MAVVRVINWRAPPHGPNPDDHRTPSESACSGVERTAPSSVISKVGPKFLQFLPSRASTTTMALSAKAGVSSCKSRARRTPSLDHLIGTREQ
jgi:hypothetical protein